jgi:hypothetical protein
LINGETFLKTRRADPDLAEDQRIAHDRAQASSLHAAATPVGSPWLWTLAFGQHEDRTPTHGYEPTREAAMAAFAKSWRRES